MRLAWFSPWPPQRSGIAGRSAELVSLLAARGHAIDVFVDAAQIKPEIASNDGPAAGSVRVLSAHEFIWRQTHGHYDLPVYQIGNSHLHRYIWAYSFRYPGLAVLHDGRVHHARAEALLSRGREDDYRAEFKWNHPGVPMAGAELALLEFDGAFFYQWPMVRSVLGTARLTAVHSRGVAGLLAQEWPNYPITHIALGEGPAALDVSQARREFRSRHGIEQNAIVFGVHGGLTEEKRIHDIIDAFAATLAWVPNARLLLVGADDPLISLKDRLKAMQLIPAAIHVPSAGNLEFDQSIAASDVTLNLRWPSAMETSGPWVRSLALARPTITIASAHQSHVPALDPLSWQPPYPSADADSSAAHRAVTVAVDILTISHGLRAAMRRLGTDAELRDRIGRQARLWWEREHTLDRMVLDYKRAFAKALECPLPLGDRPAHLKPEPSQWIHDVLAAPGWTDPTVQDRLADLLS